ncbi:hypothetical protein M413DRAFT_445985 [Hebeloma cylindrosporum]|uniref:Arrestin-like N-terminal domain-containing protein n=1 Tax=Hebeloma cylindrosporum TaxID=76867 RepID=A0A0C2XS43_HEBCY|nr:hypothetical protein M413DRAFT_445985 [Hebeloma cylindrosporum h7]
MATEIAKSQGQVHDEPDDLPSYARVREQQQQQQSTPVPATSGFGEHQRSLETAKGKKWLTQFVKSRANNNSLPIFLEGDIVSGRVELNLDKAESSKGLTVTIQGGTTFVGQEEEVFLMEEQTLWTPSGKESKLSGNHSWSFKFVLPKEVTVKESETKKESFRLPPSWTERASPAYIDYKIIVTLKRGFMRVNQTVVTNFGFHPTTLPDPPSPLRCLTYSEGSPLIGPEGDPEGWKVFPQIKIKGTLFGTKEVEVNCTLAVATPLSYAVGSPMPLMVTFTGEDPYALDVLTKPGAIQLKLRRSMATGSEATDDNGVRRTDNYFQEESGMAYFWPSPSQGGAMEVNKRVLQGELEVVKGLKPSFKFPKFTVRYSLDLLPFIAPGFVPAGVTPNGDPGKRTVLLTEWVVITTKQIPGLVPQSYAPPGYEKPQGVDYNKSLGLLENGNQRFLGHTHGYAR